VDGNWVVGSRFQFLLGFKAAAASDARQPQIHFQFLLGFKLLKITISEKIYVVFQFLLGFKEAEEVAEEVE